MPRIQTHYDNLKVARDAPDEVIRAAYRTLSQKHHPDRNPGNAQAARIMQILNAAYAVLSDPVARKRHDEWIRQAENKASGSPSSEISNSASATVPQTERHRETSKDSLGTYVWFAIGVAFVLAPLAYDKLQSTRTTPPPTAPSPTYEAKPAAVTPDFSHHGIPNPFAETKPKGSAAEFLREAIPAPRAKYERPPLAPNGEPWPQQSAYLNGAPRRFGGGRSLITVDNTQNNSDALVKIINVDSTPRQARVFFLRANDSFTVRGMRAGSYDLRYQDLDSGGLSRSPVFELNEITEEDGVRYSNVSITLYRVASGNMRMVGIPDSDFNLE